jgi:hypothetical protein
MRQPPREPAPWGEPLDAPDPALDVAADDPADQGTAGGTATGEREPLYPNVADWLHHYLLPNYRRRLLHTRWCRRWWEHAEAISRLEAIWQAWEAMRYVNTR